MMRGRQWKRSCRRRRNSRRPNGHDIGGKVDFHAKPRPSQRFQANQGTVKLRIGQAGYIVKEDAGIKAHPPGSSLERGQIANEPKIGLPDDYSGFPTHGVSDVDRARMA